jgi:GTP-binding protein
LSGLSKKEFAERLASCAFVLYTDDIAGAYKTIRQELSNYNLDLDERPEVIALTKIDGLDDDIIQMQIDAVKSVAGDKPVFAISSVAHKGLKEVLRELRRQVMAARLVVVSDEDVEDEEIATISLGKEKMSEAWAVEKIEEEDKVVYQVTGKKIEKFAIRTDFGNYEAANRLRDIMKKLGIAHELRRQGAEGDSVIRIGNSEFTLLEQ